MNQLTEQQKKKSKAAISGYVGQITKRHRRNCGDAVLAGMHMIALQNDYGLEHGGDRRSLGISSSHGNLKKGFIETLKEIDVPTSSAYRWMAKAEEVADALGYTRKDFPLPDTEEWAQIEGAVEKMAEGASLLRISLGTAGCDDENRMESLITAIEAGDENALAFYQAYMDGEKTLVQAVRGFSGATATKGKPRGIPVYLKMDGENGTLSGLFMKSLPTLKHTFEKWNELDPPARVEARKYWLEIIKLLPPELK